MKPFTPNTSGFDKYLREKRSQDTRKNVETVKSGRPKDDGKK